MTATKKKGSRANGTPKEGQDTNAIGNTHVVTPEQLQAKRTELEKARAKREKIRGWDLDKVAKADAEILTLSGELEVAELGAMPVPAQTESTINFYESDLSIDSIVITGNHREQDDAPETIRLARTLKTLGLQQRIGVRYQGGGTHELIFGSRRLTAAKSIGWEMIPAKVYPQTLTAAEVEIIRTVENFGRKELTAVERAIAVARTIDAVHETINLNSPINGFSDDKLNKAFESSDPKVNSDAKKLQADIDAAGGLHAYVGQQLGFPAKWVADNAYVSKLGGEARALLAAGRISIGHARELAKLGDPAAADQIARIVSRREDGTGGDTVQKCARYVTESLRSLRMVPWRLDVAFGGGVKGCTCQACATCKFNSKSDPDLFGGALADEPEAGVCTNETCFKAKTEISAKDVDKAKDKVVKQNAKSGAVVNETLAQQFVPIYIKPATVVRKAKKEIDAAAAGKPASGGKNGEKQQTSEEIAKQKLQDAIHAWGRAAEKKVTEAILGSPERYLVACLLDRCPEISSLIDAYGQEQTEKALAASAGVLEIAKTGDTAALVAHAIKAAKAQKIKWHQRIPLFDNQTNEELTAELAKMWNIPLKPMPVLEDFLPKAKESVTAKTLSNPFEKARQRDSYDNTPVLVALTNHGIDDKARLAIREVLKGAGVSTLGQLEDSLADGDDLLKVYPGLNESGATILADAIRAHFEPPAPRGKTNETESEAKPVKAKKGAA